MKEIKVSGVIFPYALEWSITNACNLRCKYCSEYRLEYVNITVNSVIYEGSLKNRGIENLNEALFEINQNIWHMLCPIYPANRPDSIINDEILTKSFFKIIGKLKRKNRRVIVNFPTYSRREKFILRASRCYRRYFRIRLIENKNFFSPYPPANLLNPLCNKPCNCALFINDVLFAKNKKPIRGSQLKERLNLEEVEKLRIFVRTYINPKLSDDVYEDLLKKQSF